MPNQTAKTDPVPLKGGTNEAAAGEIAEAAAGKVDRSVTPPFPDRPPPQQTNQRADAPRPTGRLSEMQRLNDKIQTASAKLIALLGEPSEGDPAVAARCRTLIAHQAMVAAHQAMIAAFGFALGG